MSDLLLQESISIINTLKESIKEGVAHAIHNHQLSNQKIVYLENKKIKTVTFKVEIYKRLDGFYSYRVVSSDRQIIEKGKKYRTRSECLRAIRTSKRQAQRRNLRNQSLKTNFA